jgi:hypothetical protein
MHNAAIDREKFSWLRYVAMAFLLKHLVWLDRGAFLRACSEVFLLGTVLLLASRWRWRISIFATPIARWAVCIFLCSVGGR